MWHALEFADIFIVMCVQAPPLPQRPEELKYSKS